MSHVPSSSESIPGGYGRFLLPGFLVLSLFVVLWWRRPTPQPSRPLTLSWILPGRIFGTTYTIKVLPHSPSTQTQEALHQEIKGKLAQIDLQMSTYNKKSELSRFNVFREATPFSVSPELVAVVAEAQRVSRLTGGAFDVTIGPVVNAWGFGPKKRSQPPSQEELARARQAVGYRHLFFQTSPPALQKKLPHLYVDLSAIAKGYAVDAVALLVEKHRYTNYMVEIGGEVRARGTNPQGQPWRIGIEKPTTQAQQDIELVVPLHNTAMATSGNYRNFVMVQGKLVPHIIDARTSIPVTHGLASVTVIHPSCMTADALATAMFVLGTKEGLPLAEKENLAVLFLEPHGRSFVSKASSAFQRLLQPQPSVVRTTPKQP